MIINRKLIHNHDLHLLLLLLLLWIEIDISLLKEYYQGCHRKTGKSQGN